jgi:glycosyltransferase involved in cell wall biosynthesis
LETNLIKPRFSIVIPTYNRASQLKATLDSVLAQTFTDFEVLVLDDGSTDGTSDLVKSFDDYRIRYEWAPNSGGPATPRNRGIDGARADWICFLDADDRWYKDKLEKLAEILETTPGLDLICHNEIMSVLATGRKTYSNYGPFAPNFYEVMLRWGNRVSTSATSVRREFLFSHGLRFNQSSDYVIVEDYDMWLRIAFHGGVFHFMSDYCGEYVIADTNISSNMQRAEHNQSVLLRNHVYNVQKFQPDKDRLWREISAGLLISKSKNQIAQKRYILGTGSLIRAFRGSFAGSFRYIASKARNKLTAYSQRSDRSYKGSPVR